MPVTNSAPFAEMARVHNSAVQSIATGTFVAITFDSERYDPAGMHSTGSNTSRITVPVAGRYHIGGCIAIAQNATNPRIIALRVDGATYIALVTQQNAGATTDTLLNISCDYELAAGSYVELIGYQASGGSLNSLVNANYTPEFWVHRIS